MGKLRGVTAFASCAMREGLASWPECSEFAKLNTGKITKVPFAPRLAFLCLAGLGAAAGVTVLAVSGGSGRTKARATAGSGSVCNRPAGTHPARMIRPGAGTIAFVRWAGGSYAVFVMPATGGRAHRLSLAPGHPFPSRRHVFQGDPAWSPDGSRIAFTSNRTGRSGIYVMRADGSQTRKLTISDDGDVRPSWSPDGRRIVFARSGRGRLYVIDADGRNLRTLTRTVAVADSDPAWSPDGTRIAFVRRPLGGGLAAIYLIGSDGHGLCRLTPFTRSVFGPAWSPDGTKITYTNRERTGFAIAVVGADGTGRRTLTREWLDFTPAWSADGTKIVFAREATLYEMNADGSGLRRLTRGTIDDSPAWRPT
jgi:Tol biopolymer transport system component